MKLASNLFRCCTACSASMWRGAHWEGPRATDAATARNNFGILAEILVQCKLKARNKFGAKSWSPNKNYYPLKIFEHSSTFQCIRWTIRRMMLSRMYEMIANIMMLVNVVFRRFPVRQARTQFNTNINVGNVSTKTGYQFKKNWKEKMQRTREKRRIWLYVK